MVDGTELWVESSDQSTTLVIAQAQPDYAGRYTVVVKDRRSSAEHTVTISVVGENFILSLLTAPCELLSYKRIKL